MMLWQNHILLSDMDVSGGHLTLDPLCCCCCATAKLTRLTLYGAACITNCDCDSGSPLVVTFEATYNSGNSRWEGSISFSGCAKTLNFRITCTDDVTGTTVLWSDDGCTGTWSTPEEMADTENCGCAPFWLTHSLGGSDEYLLDCCPDETTPPFPQLTMYIYCDEATRDTLLCDP